MLTNMCHFLTFYRLHKIIKHAYLPMYYYVILGRGLEREQKDRSRTEGSHSCCCIADCIDLNGFLIQTC